MGIKKIMCCCGQGLGSSLMIRLNVEKALKKLGISGVEVMHSSLSDDAADLFVVGGDLENFTHSFPKVVLLENIMSMPELEEKLKKAFDEAQ
jgi:PTS system ascorbate-specific IIB component